MISILKRILWSVYLLQLENYDVSRFMRAYNRHSYIPSDTRKEIVWTKKLILIVGLASLVALGVTLFIPPLLFPDMVAWIILSVILLIAFSYYFYVPLVVVVIILSPLDLIVKQRIVSKARRKISLHPNLKVVAITGSYGKTTMRHVVSSILEERKNILCTTENYNTPLGISRQIISELTDEIEVYVVEMGAYKRGDISYLCSITQPDVAILTGINEAHLERQGSIENIIETKFEIVQNAKEDALIILNADDDHVRENAPRFLKPSQRVEWYGSSQNDSWARVEDQYLDPKRPGQNFTLIHNNEREAYQTNFLARYISGVVMAARIVSEHFKISPALVRERVSRLKPVEHRLYPTVVKGNVLVIDDAYNGNPDGVREALEILASFKDRERIVVTPGLVEMGEREERVHREIARQLVASADQVLLIRTPGSEFIKDELDQRGFKNVSVFDAAHDAHRELQSKIVDGAVVLFQNDVSENYQ